MQFSLTYWQKIQGKKGRIHIVKIYHVLPDKNHLTFFEFRLLSAQVFLEDSLWGTSAIGNEDKDVPLLSAEEKPEKFVVWDALPSFLHKKLYIKKKKKFSKCFRHVIIYDHSFISHWVENKKKLNFTILIYKCYDNSWKYIYLKFCSISLENNCVKPLLKLTEWTSGCWAWLAQSRSLRISNANIPSM